MENQTNKTCPINSFVIFLKRFYDYLIKTMNGMAFGLFSTLIIGTIIGQIASIIKYDINLYFFVIENVKLVLLGNVLKSLMGIGIGVGIAWSLKLDGLRLISAAAAGGIATLLRLGQTGMINLGLPGDPVVAFLVVVVSIELVRVILRKRTPVDIIIIPLLSSLIAFLTFLIVDAPIRAMMESIGSFIQWSTLRQPLIMGLLIAVAMGMLLTSPMSSAAVAVAISLGGIAGGAAVVGCATQMLGFAVMSRKDNNIGTVISIGIGTSMLQFKNVMKKPIIWLPPIIVSAILGPLATTVFLTETDRIGAGMGTSGLVGQFRTIETMVNAGYNTNQIILSILLLQILLPITLVLIVDLLFRKFNLIKTGDLKI